ncbi:hypothetical protein K458DRAFT_395832 [Lentithecium fluviatile CBS 122367]|uniref:Uncharacterized protein n=1 Tax=Lentithecium fluviatile CBS 122367 TaxID=1168545 RepID=A0A6G1IHJ3_9PLEO|nr:hypothetical protein K458DRAFT_395832 [Lentithecium fluviatile CBS 122367]
MSFRRKDFPSWSWAGWSGNEANPISFFEYDDGFWDHVWRMNGSAIALIQTEYELEPVLPHFQETPQATSHDKLALSRRKARDVVFKSGKGSFHEASESQWFIRDSYEVRVPHTGTVVTWGRMEEEWEGRGKKHDFVVLSGQYFSKSDDKMKELCILLVEGDGEIKIRNRPFCHVDAEVRREANPRMRCVNLA